MPIPAIIGASAISGFLAGLLVKVIEFLGSRLVRKFVIAAALIVAIFAAITPLVNSLSSGASTLLSMIPQWPAEMVPMLIPMTVLKFCLTTIITGEIIVAFSALSVWLVKVVKGV